MHFESYASAVVYHVYALGYCGAPRRASDDGPSPRLLELERRLPEIARRGFDLLLLGPVFSSESHGYDVLDQSRVDPRLGRDEDLARLVARAHELGLRVLLDAVFNHVGRAHPWFQALRAEGPGGPAARRFKGVSAAGRSPLGDPFAYSAWEGHPELPELDLGDPDLRAEQIALALGWIEDFGIDGLRLDTAEILPEVFLDELAAACRARKPGFWLMGEAIHGDYARLARDGRLDSVTNYECWKGLWSSMNDGNCFEIAHSLERQFGERGLYRGFLPFAFAENHDVSRIVSQLREARRAYPLYIALFGMPGVPSVYYGGEFGAPGLRSAGSDAELRPSMAALEARASGGRAAGFEPELGPLIERLCRLKRTVKGLRGGEVRVLEVRPRVLAFERFGPEGRALVAINASDEAVDLELRPRQDAGAAAWTDRLAGDETFACEGGALRLRLHPNWGRILAPD